jgi:hypothetical protein
LNGGNLTCLVAKNQLQDRNADVLRSTIDVDLLADNRRDDAGASNCALRNTIA